MPAADSSRRQGLLGGVLVTLVAEGIAMPAGLITAAVLTRSLGPELYGSFIVAASTVSTLEWLLIALLARAVVKVVAEAENWRAVATTSFRAYVLLGAAIGAGIWLLAEPVAALLDDPSLAHYFRLFAPQIPIFAVGAACKGVLAGRGQYREQALASAVGWISRVGFIVLFVWLGWGVDGAILGSISGVLAGSLVSLAMTGSSVWQRTGARAGELMQVAMPAFLAMLGARLLDQVGILALEALGTDAAEVGYYGAAMNVLMVTSMIAAAVTPALVSALTAAERRGDRGAVDQMTLGSLRFGLVLFPFAAIVAGASHELVPLLFGDAFAAAAPLMALLIVGAIARSSVVVSAAALVSLSRAWLAAVLAAPLPVLAVAAHWFVIPRYGALGAAWVSAALAVAGCVVSIVVLCRVRHLPLPWGTTLRATLISAGIYTLALGWPAPDPLLLFVKLSLLSVGVCAAFLATGELAPQEIATLRAMLPSRPPGAGEPS